MLLDLSQCTILVVDDNLLFRTYLKKLIEINFKAKVVELENPKEMFTWLKTNEPSLIILDMEMPYMDGYTALRLMRGEDKLKNLDVIACTAISSAELVARLVELKIADFIVKKSDSKVVAQKILKFFQKNPSLIKN